MQLHGVREFTVATSELERATEEIQVSGYTVVPHVLGPDEIEVAKERLEIAYRKQVEEIGGEQCLLQIREAFAARCLLAYDEIFLTVAVKPSVLDIAAKFLGDYYTLMAQAGLLNVPRRQAVAGAWHRDLPSTHFVSSRPLAITAAICLDPFTEENGATLVLPGSHKHEPFPSEDYVRRHETPILAPAGAAIVFDAMLFHRGGLNRSNNPRRMVNTIYSLPIFRQVISFPKMLDGKYSDDRFLSRLLGYEAEAYGDVTAYREQMLQKTVAKRAKAAAF